MSVDLVKIAAAFSSHRFEETYDALAPDARWIGVGQFFLDGKEAIIAACSATTAELATTHTEFTRFVTISEADAVAVDAIARYTGSDGAVSVVSSCDIYEVDDDRIKLITSYAVELRAA